MIINKTGGRKDVTQIKKKRLCEKDREMKDSGFDELGGLFWQEALKNRSVLKSTSMSINLPNHVSG